MPDDQTLREERDRAQAEAAALREVLEAYYVYQDESGLWERRLNLHDAEVRRNKARAVLTDHTAGAALVERVRRLEAVKEAAWDLYVTQVLEHSEAGQRLAEALVALEGEPTAASAEKVPPQAGRPE